MAATASFSPKLERPHLLRILGLTFGLAVGVGSMIGGGILRAPGAVMDQVPFPAIALGLWALAALHAMISANVIAEVMTAVPRSGGLFVPARAAFGRSGGLLIGWTDWLNQIAGIAALSIACGEFLALIVPALQGHQGAAGAAISLVLVLINLAGVREGSAVQIAGSGLKIMLLVGLAFAVFLMPSTAPPSAAPAEAIVRPLSLWGIVVAYQLIIGVMAGWPNPAYFSEEDTAPGRNIPRALFSSIAAVSALYLLVNGALVYALPLDQLRASELPIALALGNIFGPLGMKIVAAAAIVIIMSCNNANFMVGSRVLYGLAQEGLFPSAAKRVNGGGTPHLALILTAVFALLLTLTGKFELMFLIMGALGLLPLLVAEAAIFKLRRTSPDLPRPYRAFAYPWLPAVALLIDVSLLLLFIAADWKSGLSIIAAVAICIPIGWVMRSSSQSAQGGSFS
jgi:APA family basic amino acid/polyamine antiporter